MLYNYACKYHISTVVHIGMSCVTAQFFFAKSDLLIVRFYINCDLELVNGIN